MPLDPTHPYRLRREKWLSRAEVPDHEYTWDHVPAAAREWCKLYVQSILDEKPGPGLMLYGPPGRGKTAAAALTLRDCMLKGTDMIYGRVPGHVPYRPGFYISYSDFLRTYRRSWDAGQEDSASLIDDLFYSSATTWTRTKVLVLDDVGKEQPGSTGFNKTVLHDLFRSRWDKGVNTIVTTNSSPEQFGEYYGDAMADFIWEGFVFVSFENEPSQRR